jgi:hypothetical protein
MNHESTYTKVAHLVIELIYVVKMRMGEVAIYRRGHHASIKLI